MRNILIASFFLLPIFCISQDADKPKIRFGKVAPDDFEIKSSLIDSNTNAIVISDVGITSFNADANNKKFSLEFKRERRVKLLNKNGFDIATMVIPLYTEGNSTEKLDRLKAYTYNLENGKVVKTSLESSSVFSENATKKLVLKKFTLPALKEGCIIEVSYTVTSDFLFNLQPWSFQSEYPTLWSEYNAAIPSFFTYLPLSQGYQTYLINSQSSQEVKYSFRDEATIVPGSNGGRIPAETWEMKGELNSYKWVMKDVPGIKEESFTTTLSNHIAKLDFQLMSYQYPNTIPKNLMSDWAKVGSDLMEDEKFGKTFTRPNNWLDNPIKAIVGAAKSKLEVAHNIYEYVRNNFTVTKNGYMSEEANLKEIFRKQSGNVAEINLLLIAMLRHEGISADPIILSTRRNGVIHPVYPLMDRFNYLICTFEIDSANYYLDATEPMLGFGKLPVRCFNGNAWLIQKQPVELAIDANSLKESKVTTFFFINDDKGNYTGSFNSDLGYFESLDLRDKIKKQGKETVIKEFAKEYAEDIAVKNVAIDSLDKYDVPVKLSYELQVKFDEDVIYLNPLFNQTLKKNPFTTSTRQYPVEMPYTSDKNIVVNIEIPKGYVVDELPKSARVKLNDDEGMFEYIIGVNENNIQLRCRLTLNRAVYDKEDYETLRDFYSYVIKKEAEQIVFKKLK
jgi:hypothetical protein